MYNPFSRFVLRTPLLSFERLAKLLKDRDSLLQGLDDEYIREAIYVASPDLYKDMGKWQKGLIADKKEIDRIAFSLARYISRMSTRCTPFGLFAGCSVGYLSGAKSMNDCRIVLNGAIERHTRPDMFYLCTLVQELSKMPTIRNCVRYFPNTSLYQVGNRYRYIEYEYGKSSRTHRITSVDRSSYLAQILKMAGYQSKSAKGITLNEMADYLVNLNVLREDAVAYINELIDSQVIVSELEASVTGDGFLDRLIALLDALPTTISILPHLIKIKEILTQIDENNGNTIEKYEALKIVVKEIQTPFEEKFIFQSDITKNVSEAIIGQDVMREVSSTMRFLNKITSADTSNEDLRRFIQLFSERYEEREVSLMEALDTEMGIGYPANRESNTLSPLIDNLALPNRSNRETTIRLNVFQSLLHRKAVESLAHNRNEIVFTDEDIKDMKENWNDLPPTLLCMFKILQSETNETWITLNSFHGSSGANLLARFAHTNPDIEQLVKEITHKEQKLTNKALLAEIAHLPDSRVGNILSRPHIRDYEILYLASSDLTNDRIIRVSDLTVSVRNGRIRLWSKQQNCEIIPRLTNAHNYRNSEMPVYRFLCDIQIADGRQGLFFTWGSVGNMFDFRPRIVYRNTILSVASWTVKINEIKHLFLLRDHALIEAANLWREKRAIPLCVLLDDGDNELFVDFNNPLVLQSFFSIVKNRNVIQLSEFLYDKNKSVVRDNDRKPSEVKLI